MTRVHIAPLFSSHELRTCAFVCVCVMWCLSATSIQQLLWARTFSAYALARARVRTAIAMNGSNKAFVRDP